MRQEKQLGGDRISRRAILLISLLIGANVGAWVITGLLSPRFSFLLATGWLAYAFGLRHAVDADHIAAIDNTTRKLMGEDKRPLGVGFFFSLGHSTIVLLLCALVAAATAYVQHCLPAWKSVGSEIGTIISGGFLYLIGLVNLLVLVDLLSKAKKLSRGEMEEELTDSIPGPGLFVRLLRPVLQLVRHSWQMYFVGLLFGLGFDTASEVGILALSAGCGQTGVSFWVIMLLPVLFTVGMCLVDTLDGILMLGVYGWALDKPVRKLSYNLVITGISVLVAFVIGTYEILGMLNAHNFSSSPFWAAVYDHLGLVIVGLSASCWAVATIVSKAKRAVPNPNAANGN